MRKLMVVLLALLVFTTCSTKPKQDLKPGVWRGVIELQGQELPFNFAVLKDSTGTYSAFIKNADENLYLDEIKKEDDSIVFVMHIFDSELKVRAEGDSLKGYFIKNYEQNYRLPFKAAFNQDFRFTEIEHAGTKPFGGKYAVTFFNPSDTTEAVGLFASRGRNIITGTFLTPTGDYRYLEGITRDDKIFLSTFDGNHAYLFIATRTSDSTLTGEYWSGKTGYYKWFGKLDANASLPDAESLTYLKDGYEKIEFRFPDINGKMISQDDKKYENKILILQLFGTWCPNCMDETKFLSRWYKENNDRGVEIIGLAYEAKDDFDYASSRVKKMRSRLNVGYDFVVAGTKDKASASATLPMLNNVVAFPTLIFIGKDGKVKKIHTGFTGPGTGGYYDQFVEEFNQTVNELLAGDPAL